VARVDHSDSFRRGSLGRAVRAVGAASRLRLAQVAESVHKLQFVFDNAVFQVFDSESSEVALQEGRVFSHERLDSEEERSLGDTVPVLVGESGEVLADLLGAK